MMTSWLAVLLVSTIYRVVEAGPILSTNATATLGVNFYPTQGTTYRLRSGRYRLTYFDPITPASFRGAIPALSLQVAIDKFQEDLAEEIKRKGKDYRVYNQREYDKDGVNILGYIPSSVAYGYEPTLEDIDDLFGGLLEAYHLQGLNRVARIEAQKLRGTEWHNTWTILLYYFSGSANNASGNETTSIWS